MSAWPTDAEREAVRETLAVEITVGFRDEAGDDAYQWGVMDSDDRSALADAALAALAPHVAALVRAERAAAWDEGFDAGHQAARAVNPEWPGQPTNPYRPDRVEDDR